jgi:hypothetical protein
LASTLATLSGAIERNATWGGKAPRTYRLRNPNTITVPTTSNAPSTWTIDTDCPSSSQAMASAATGSTFRIGELPATPSLGSNLQERGIELSFAEMKGPVKDKLKRFGLFGRFGQQTFFATVDEAVHAYLAAHPPAARAWRG